MKEVRQLKSSFKSAETKPRGKPPARKTQTYKCDKRNPGKYVPHSEWMNLEPEQQEAVRTAREQEGAPKRKIKLLSTQDDNSEGTVVDDSDDEFFHESNDGILYDHFKDQSSLKSIDVHPTKSMKQVHPSLLVAPTYTCKPMVTSQRKLHYAGTNPNHIAIAKKIISDAKKDLQNIGALST